MTSNSTFGQETTAEEVAGAFASHITGKTILITGANPNGLGAAAASALAAHSPRLLILTARTPARAATVISSLQTANPSSSTQYAIVALDLSSLASVRMAAAEIQTLAPEIDIIINNAGVMAIPERTLSADGVEMHLATNFLGHFLLTTLLIPQLKAAREGSRVVNITSAGFVLTGFRFGDWNWEGGKTLPAEEHVNSAVAEMMGFKDVNPSGGYVPMFAYAQANVANMLFTQRLAAEYAKDGIASFSAAPGVVVTDLQRHLPKDFRNPYMFYKTPSQGVSSFLVAALDPAIQATPGAYINDCQTAATGPNVDAPATAERLWKLAEELTKA